MIPSSAAPTVFEAAHLQQVQQTPGASWPASQTPEAAADMSQQQMQATLQAYKVQLANAGAVMQQQMQISIGMQQNNQPEADPETQLLNSENDSLREVVMVLQKEVSDLTQEVITFLAPLAVSAFLKLCRLMSYSEPLSVPLRLSVYLSCVFSTSQCLQVCLRASQCLAVCLSVSCLTFQWLSVRLSVSQSLYICLH